MIGFAVIKTELIVPGLTTGLYEQSKEQLIMAYAKVLSIPETLVEMMLKTISRLKRAIVKDPNHGIIVANVVAQNESSLTRIDAKINEESFVAKLNKEMDDSNIMIEAIANITIENQTGNTTLFRFIYQNN